jgi:uncharacterized protein YndB with AHSA1/START domain
MDKQNHSPDRIEMQALLHAPIEKVWQAISEAEKFGSWFGVRFDGPFEAGQPLSGKITPTTVDPEVAESQKPYEGAAFNITVERIEPMYTFSFRWHPYAVDPETDYSKEPTTLVAFELEEAGDGTRLTITESGFDRIPAERRDDVYKMNQQGWEAQLILIGKFLGQ